MSNREKRKVMGSNNLCGRLHQILWLFYYVSFRIFKSFFVQIFLFCFLVGFASSSILQYWCNKNLTSKSFHAFFRGEFFNLFLASGWKLLISRRKKNRRASERLILLFKGIHLFGMDILLVQKYPYILIYK